MLLPPPLVGNGMKEGSILVSLQNLSFPGPLLSLNLLFLPNIYQVVAIAQNLLFLPIYFASFRLAVVGVLVYISVIQHVLISAHLLVLRSCVFLPQLNLRA